MLGRCGRSFISCRFSVRNNGRTSDIHRPNEAFVQPLVIWPDILSGGVASGVEFRMSNPHPRTSQCHVNKRSFQSSHTKQMQTATRRHVHCTVQYCMLYCTCILSNPGCSNSRTHAGAPRVACATKMQRTATGLRDTCPVHGERGRIRNSEIFACNVFFRGCKSLKMSRLIA